MAATAAAGDRSERCHLGVPERALPLLSSVWMAIHSVTVTFVAACLA